MPTVALRRVNEWDGPAMLKIYEPYVGSCHAPEDSLPDLQDYIRRIDRYTYGLGWLICEIDGKPVGFCHLTEDRRQPENLFWVEFQLYVKQDWQRRGVGLALWTMMKDIMELGSRKKVSALISPENELALSFFPAVGFAPAGEEGGLVRLEHVLSPADPQADKPVKPYLVENLDYERSREAAAKLVIL